MATFHSPHPQTVTAPHSTCTTTDRPSHLSSANDPAVQYSHHSYNLSPRTQDDSSATEENNEFTEEDNLRRNAQTASSRSSISSFPASVAPNATFSPTKKPKLQDLSIGSPGDEENGRRWRQSPFRNPSSVRSIQMRDEDDAISHHGKRTPRISRNMSTISARSPDSISQTKRRRDGESLLSPKNAKVKKEFPLVLLHCSLLPPTMPIQARISDAVLMQAVLPEEYWQRWKLLCDKITNDIEIQGRGVLIPHPKADYELLEERLLESLELVKPRLRSGHFFGNEDVDVVEESESDTETARQGTKCQDCGRRVVKNTTRDREWEVKVYAANGLMRAGAWSAAWNEMEKVDVEVSVNLPQDIRREVEERCLRLGIEHEPEAEVVNGYEASDAERRRREVYGTFKHDPQEKIDDLFEASDSHNDAHQEAFRSQLHYQHHVPPPTIELRHLFISYVSLLAQDRRNVVIAVLSLGVLFFAFGTSPPPQQGFGWSKVPVNVSVPPSEVVPHCTHVSISSVIPAPVVPTPVLLADSTPTSKDCVRLTECNKPMISVHPPVVLPEASISSLKDSVILAECNQPITSAGASAANVQAPIADRSQEFVEETGL
ncbi:hypothetical protein GJ744_006524 [Endocarpon pusillum]|uniref:Uncharacterized protein n=1 Tax=Endocarpon pusillum TaxID=364733 RepID=A0A8H7E9W1_9EURO|nr:hypothetical protein GJ744_006524 [Endocarpon pusillum]